MSGSCSNDSKKRRGRETDEEIEKEEEKVRKQHRGKKRDMARERLKNCSNTLM